MMINPFSVAFRYMKKLSFIEKLIIKVLSDNKFKFVDIIKDGEKVGSIVRTTEPRLMAGDLLGVEPIPIIELEEVTKISIKIKKPVKLKFINFTFNLEGDKNDDDTNNNSNV